MQVLARLLGALFHPAAETTAPGLCQMLSVFFPGFSGLAAANAELLGLAALPAARQALATMPAGPSSQKGIPARLLLYALQQIQAGSLPSASSAPMIPYAACACGVCWIGCYLGGHSHKQHSPAPHAGLPRGRLSTAWTSSRGAAD